MVLIEEARAPITMLNPSPLRVLTNISLPIQSVPNGCSREGARFFDSKSVDNALSSMNVLETTIAINNTDRKLVSIMVFCRRLNPPNKPLLTVATALLMFSSPAALSSGR